MALLLALVIFCGAIPPFQDDPSPDKNTLKALFIYNFTKHIEWPPITTNSTGKFIISVCGERQMIEKLTTVMKGRKIAEKAVEIKQITLEEEIRGSHILFISKGQYQSLKSIAELAAEPGLLIVTEEKGAIPKGSCINLIEKDHHLRFEINTSLSKKKNLKVSNQLINLATGKP